MLLRPLKPVLLPILSQVKAKFLRVYGPPGGQLREVASCAEAHGGDVNCVRWHPQEATLLASAGDDGAVHLWRFTAPAE